VKREVRAGALALGVVGLLLLVTVAARGGHPTTSGTVSARPVPDTVQNSLITLLAIVYVIVILAIIVAVFRRHTWTEPKILAGCGTSSRYSC
jgi:uncharacterized membrane protein